MKIKISESKIRQIVNEEVLKSSLNKTIKEQTWPNYSAYLLAEVLKLEWESTLTESNSEQKPSPEWIAETASAFGLSDKEIQEATDVMDNDELEEGVGGFLKAVAKPYQNIWKTFTNITQHAADFTDPAKKKAAAVIDKVDDKMPAPEELAAKAKSDPDELAAMMRQILDILKKTDSAVDLDQIKPGLEQGIDQAVDQVDTAVDQTAGGEAGGEAGGAPTVSVFKGKGGKGLQSFLDRSKSGVPGKVYGAILKHVANNLKQQGVTVTESVLDDVQGWIWYGLVEGAVRDQHGEAALNEIIGEEVAMGQTIGKARAKAGAEAGAAAGGGREITPGHECTPEEDGTIPNFHTEKFGPDGKGVPCPGAGTKAGAEGGEASGAVIQIYKGKKGVGLQSWMDMNREKLGIDDTAVKVLLMTVEDWAKANNLRVETLSHKMLGRVLPEVLNKHKVRKLQEVIHKLRS